MKKMPFFLIMCIFTNILFGQNTKTVTSYKGKSSKEPVILATKNINIYSLNDTNTCIQKCYKIYIKQQSGKIITTSFGNNKNIGATTTNDYTFQVWLAEIDPVTKLETGFESNTLVKMIPAGNNSFHIELKEFDNSGQIQNRTTKPPGELIIIGAGSPGID